MQFYKEEIEKNVRDWLSALRSGEYQQVKGTLKTNKGHCCLGVACEVLKQKLNLVEGVLLREDNDLDHNIFSERFTFNRQSATLPRNVQMSLGLNDMEGCFYGERSLSQLNDRGLSFLQIADLIESQPVGLFHIHLDL